MKNNNYKYIAKINMKDDSSSFVKILKRIPAKSKVLEFGPAYGYMTRYMTEELLCDVTCVEIDPDAAEETKKYCNNMIIADIEKLDFGQVFENLTFDIITFGDVLEHLYNPGKVIKNCYNILKDNGKVLVSIPNITHISVISNLIMGRFEYSNSGILDNTHIRFFSRESILQLFTNNYYYAIIADRVKSTEFNPIHKDLKFDLLPVLNKMNPEYETYQFIIEAKKINSLLVKEIKQLKETLLQKQREIESYESKFSRFNLVTKVLFKPQKAFDRLVNKFKNTK